VPEQLIEEDFFDPMGMLVESHSQPLIDHRIIPSSDSAIAAINDVVASVISVDVDSRKLARKRRRRADDLAKLVYCIRMILSNLIVEVCAQGSEASVRISRSNRDKKASRYKPNWLTVTMTNAATELLEQPKNDLIVLNKGMHSLVVGEGIQSTLKSSEGLLLLAQGYSKDDFTHAPELEVIVLKSKEKGGRGFSGGRPKGKRIEYVDTDYTQKARNDMRAINGYLREADIEFKGIALPHKDRQLIRYFNEDFSRGGRLFKGRWQAHSKAERHLYAINGGRCVEVDFKACNLYLAYACAGLSLPECVEGDPYTFRGAGMSLKRDGIKTIMLAMLCADKPLTVFPSGTRKASGAGRSEKFKDIETLIVERHKAIAHLFYTGIGMRLQYKESEIIVATLLDLQNRGVVALPIHDCVVVAEEDQTVAKSVMLEAFLGVSGQHGEVVIDSL